ncbi:unnamed protein product [Bursaphelenchus okinawaensis]|uniref:Uncharacterized protein n=1 Tax=Bursaphelenchus okinawaensis TaxID=465554 RepID=A0A811L7I2_9BILA|nr:unnamed protein product [Bursaphelenchus okinawaensis]CAG9118036.1 unnamed protein product [Bursaphelenchus okinawaensis]
MMKDLRELQQNMNEVVEPPSKGEESYILNQMGLYESSPYQKIDKKLKKKNPMCFFVSIPCSKKNLMIK